MMKQNRKVVAVMKKRVAIIGAGPSGLSLLRAFHWALQNGASEEDLPEIVCYEKQSDWGGMWNFTWQTGVGHDGEPVHAGMYRNLWTNGPKELVEFADYSFHDHFGNPLGSYPPRPVITDYVKARAEKSGLRKWVRFDSPVRLVTYSEENGRFTITVHDRSKDEIYSQKFDHVVVATGHFSTPYIPHLEGMNAFHGRLLHSHDLRDVREFNNRDVLIVGGSRSAEDIASQCYKYGSKSITISYHGNPTGIEWPANFKEVSSLKNVDPNGRTCHFKDGCSKDVDVIILCTGYKHDFPFMTDDLRLKTENRFWPIGLFEGVVWESNPKLFYLAMQKQFFSFSMFDAQAWYVRDVIMGRIKLPSRAEMAEHSRKWSRLEEEALRMNDDLRLMSFQAEYVKELLEQVDYPLSKEQVEQLEQLFYEWSDIKNRDIMTYRDHEHRSVISGAMGKKYPTPWLHAWDDSLESYLKSVAE